MYVLALEVEFRMPQSHSLKDKRAFVKPVVEGSRRRFGVSAAEVGDHDRRQFARLGFAAVASSASHAGAIIDEVERFVWSFPELEVCAADRHWLELAT